MKWFVAIEVIITLMLLGGGAYQWNLAKSTEVTGALFLGGAVMTAVTVVTVLAWWAWVATFGR